MTQRRQSLIDHWATEQGLTEKKPAQGKLTVTFDQVRVHLSELPNLRIVAQARIVDLPLNERDRERLVERALRTATGRMRDSGVALTAHPQASALWLQTQVPDNADTAALSQAVENLVNEVEFWRMAL